MKVIQIIFSPTGGTRQVAETIISQWDIPVNEIDLTNAQNDFSAFDFTGDDIAVISVPSYGGRVPALAAERIKRIHGNGTRCIIVCVYGNRAYEDTLVELNDIAEQSGFYVAAAVGAVAEHSIIRQYAAGRPDQQDKRELQSFGEKIFNKIKKSVPLCCKYQVTDPTKKPEELVWFPRQTSTVQAAGFVLEIVRHRQSARQI